MIDKERCPLCIWRNDETGKCEGSLSKHGFLHLSPFYKAHPDIRPHWDRGLGDDDCFGMEYRPKLEEAQQMAQLQQRQG